MEKEVKDFTKNSSESISIYYNRFTMQLEIILQNNASPGTYQEIAILFIDNLKLDKVMDDIHCEYVMETKIITDYELCYLKNSVMDELTYYRTRHPDCKYNKEGVDIHINRRTKSSITPTFTSPTPSTSSRSPNHPNVNPSPLHPTPPYHLNPYCPSPPQPSSNQTPERAPLDYQLSNR